MEAENLGNMSKKAAGKKAGKIRYTSIPRPHLTPNALWAATSKDLCHYPDPYDESGSESEQWGNERRPSGNGLALLDVHTSEGCSNGSNDNA